MDIVTYNGFYEKDNGWWIPFAEINALFFIDDKGKSRFIGTFDGSNNKYGSDILSIIPTKDALYFFSRAEYEFWKLNRDSMLLEYIKYADYEKALPVFVEMIGEKVWIFSNTFSVPLLTMNLKDTEIEEIPWPCRVELGEKSFTRMVIQENMVYFANRKQEDIYIFAWDCNSNNLCSRKIEGAKFVNCIEVEKERCWILYKNTRGESIIEEMLWGEDDRKLLNVSEDIELFDSFRISHFKMVKMEDYLLIVSLINNEIVKIDLNTKEITKIRNEEFAIGESANAPIVLNDFQLLEDGMILYSPSIGILQKHVYAKETIETLPLTIDEGERIKLINELRSKNEVPSESSLLRLEYFLKSIGVEV